MTEKDKSVVASMVRTGMSVEVLKKSFPQFDADEVEKIYNDEKSLENDDSPNEIRLSCNCS